MPCSRMAAITIPREVLPAKDQIAAPFWRGKVAPHLSSGARSSSSKKRTCPGSALAGTSHRMYATPVPICRHQVASGSLLEARGCELGVVDPVAVLGVRGAVAVVLRVSLA